MFAIQVDRAGGPEVLEWQAGSRPRHPGPGQLLLDMAAAGVNYVETYQRRGIYKRELPFVIGNEGAGSDASRSGPEWTDSRSATSSLRSELPARTPSGPWWTPREVVRVPEGLSGRVGRGRSSSRE